MRGKYDREREKYITDKIRLALRVQGHTNIVRVDDYERYSSADGMTLGIVIKMELLTSLREYLRSNGMDETTVVFLAKDICRALSVCKEKGIIHCDVKPDNIFVNQFGDFKLGDFGVAQAVQPAGNTGKYGTIRYMAPEVYLGETYDARIDIYSLGITLYELMNRGRIPLLRGKGDSEDVREAVQRRTRGEQFEAPADATREFSDIIMKACSYDRTARFQTAGEMLDALRKMRVCMRKYPNLFFEELDADEEEGIRTVYASPDVMGCRSWKEEKRTSTVYDSPRLEAQTVPGRGGSQQEE